ncbi:MAG: hypothetical protein E7160_03070 [Firmicutes bacterium]|nr:hypothetical protein [Bacillota bacterium]
MPGGRKKKKATYASINEKFAKAKLKKIDQLMDQLRSQVGKKGDGIKGGSKTLIGAVEGLNNEAYDGAKLTKAYKYFNDNTLPTFRREISKMDTEYNVIDHLAK